MSRPVWVATHPRACSTAFERVFMTQRDSLATIHEPFGDSFYFGPERLSERYEESGEARAKSGFQDSTYKHVVDDIEKAGSEGKRIFIKDIAYYLFPPDGKPAKIAPSLATDDEPSNPTVLPTDVYHKFQFTFLIRHPRRSIPSYYRCTIPPLDEVTGFSHFLPSEAGYSELRRLLDFLLDTGILTRDDVVVLDADDLLDKPEEAIRAFCERIDVPYSPGMLSWNDADNEYARAAFEKWNGFHDDALESSSLKPRTHQKKTCSKSEDEEWREKYGEEAQKVIRQCVDANVEHYEYLKSFALKI